MPPHSRPPPPTEPPKALTSCNVTLLDVTRMEVKCQDPAHAPAHAQAEEGGASGEGEEAGVAAAHPPYVHPASPSLSFVRSPGASSTKANMEVRGKEKGGEGWGVTGEERKGKEWRGHNGLGHEESA